MIDFKQYPQITKIVIPDSVQLSSTELSGTFTDLVNLQTVELPNKITRIGDYTFKGCSNLVLDALPTGLTTVGSQAFKDCASLTAVTFNTIPNSADEIPVSINTDAFEGCDSLTNIFVPWSEADSSWGAENATVHCLNLYEGMTEIADNVFNANKNSAYRKLALNTLPSTITSIGNYAFYYCDSLALTSLPKGITSIGDWAFYGCTNLALTSLPKRLTSIGSGVFWECTNLTLIFLPEGVSSIGNNAFAVCTNLTSVTFEGIPSAISNDVFRDCTNLLDIYVPWSEGEIAGAPWGATNATIHYNYTPEEGGNNE